MSGSPGSVDDSSGSFPGLQDALYNIQATDTAQWKVVKQQLALVTHKIRKAADLLDLSASPGADISGDTS